MNIVFDFGGVLFHWQPATFLARVWPHRSVDVAQFFQNYTGDWGAFDQGLIGADEVAARISARTGWPLHEVAEVVAAVPDELQLLPDSLALLQDLKRAGHRLFFLSNMPEPYADHLERQHPLHEWFEAGLFSGRIKLSKPSAAIYEQATGHFGVAPESLLFLDDHPVNIEAAHAAGWQGLLFKSAAQARAELQAQGLLQ